MVVGSKWLLCAGVGAAIAVDAQWVDASELARASVEVTTVAAAAFAACMLFERAEAAGRGRALTTAVGLGFFSALEAACLVLPAIGSSTGADATQAQSVAHLLALIGLAVAALTPPHIIGEAGRRGVLIAGGGLLGALLLVGTIAADPALAPPPQATHLVAVPIALVVAAVLARRALRDRSAPDAWLGAAVALLAGSHLLTGLDATASPSALGGGALLACAAAAVLLVGVLRWPGTYLGPNARQAVAQERRRIARDLHDGLAHELAFIVSHAPAVAARHDDPTAARLAEAATSALHETRLVISALTADSGEPLGSSLAHAAERVAVREGGIVRVDLQPGVEVEPRVRTELLRIVDEATTNAVRHGGASHVSLSLTERDALVLQIADDGAGFEQGAGAGAGESYTGFGLTSMSERARRAGGQLQVRSAPGAGTVVEVRID
jgi:signal transduction histidine kinase